MREFWLYPWRILPLILRLLFRTYEGILLAKGIKGFFAILVCLVVFWHIYTPIHELLHVLGCWITGGEVTELALKPQYGAHILQNFFPFIVADSDYAGQLTGFSTPNDLAYAVVDFFPYGLSIPGLALFVLARKNHSTWLFALATILGLIPLFAIPGDFFEAASLVTSRLADLMMPELPARALVSDDVFKLVADLQESGLLTLKSGLLVGLTVLLAGYACLLCFVSQWQVAVWWLGDDVQVPVSKEGQIASPESEVRQPVLES